jgi:hypothetical protein
MKSRLIIFLILAFGINILNGQEVLSGLQINETIKAEHSKLDSEKSLKTSNETEALQLPFFDDFSTSKIYPNSLLWADNDVFINSDVCFRPTNIGVATFDALDSKGAVYENADWVAFQADFLTTNTIRLDSIFTPVKRKLSPVDSVYLSFYYQPQGTGDEPEPWDTLVLEINRPTGDTVFSHYDSISVSIDYYLENANDTIFPGDTLWSPQPGCNPNVYMINYSTLTSATEYVTVLCDSVMVPEIIWDRVWKAQGMKLSEFQENFGKDFVQIMIPIKDEQYFHSNFKFRFRNYASIADDVIPSWRSNVDQWNVDYVYLNYNRDFADTTYRKLVFSERAPSFLKNYEVMPYHQYKADAPINTLRPEINTYIANLDKIGHNTKYMYTLSEVGGDYSIKYDGGSCNLPPFYSYGFQNCDIGCGAAHACPPTNSFNFNFDRDTTSYLIKHYISDSSEANILVDSTIYRQGFYNYYAYDDGTPEKGYGLEPAGAQLGYKFTLSITDTIFGVHMYFNKTLNNSNEKYFDIVVFKDNNGVPGEVVLRKENMKPKWNNGIYNFYSYIFDDPLVLNGTFYVGWEQYETGSLNIGFDTHRNSASNIYYNVGETWYQSSFNGSLLIRPIIGSVGGELIFGTQENTQEKLNIFPNPTNNSFKVDLTSISNSELAQIEIFNLYGATVLKQQGINGNIYVGNFAKGIYIVKIISGNKFYNAKLIVK